MPSAHVASSTEGLLEDGIIVSLRTQQLETVKELLDSSLEAAGVADKDGVFALTLAARSKSPAAVLQLLLDAFPLAWEQALSEVDRVDAEVVAVFEAVDALRFEETMAALDAQGRLREAASACPNDAGCGDVPQEETVRQLLSTNPQAAAAADKNGVFVLTLATRSKSPAAVLS